MGKKQKKGRRFTVEEKLRILEEARQPNTVVAEVLRRHQVDATTFYRWEKRAKEGMREAPLRIGSSPNGGGAQILLVLAFTGITSITMSLHAQTGSDASRVDHDSVADTILVSSRLACEPCAIVRGPGTELVSPDEMGLLDWPRAVAADRDGYLVSFYGFPAELHRYGFDGHFVRRVGGPGGGPAEFSYITALVSDPASGRLAVFDRGNLRLSFWAHDQLLESRRMDGGAIYSATVLPDGRYVANALIRTPDLAGYPLHVFDRFGAHIGPFGPMTLFRGDMSRAMWRELAATPEGTVWAGHFLQYVLDHYAPDGRPLQTLVRSADFFPAELRSTDITEEAGPATTLAAVTVDADGLLWVAAAAPDPRWRAGVGELRVYEGRAVYPLENPFRVWDTVVEVIDPRQGAVLTRTRFDGIAIDFVRAPALSLVLGRQDARGAVYADVVPLAFEGEAIH